MIKTYPRGFKTDLDTLEMPNFQFGDDTIRLFSYNHIKLSMIRFKRVHERGHRVDGVLILGIFILKIILLTKWL